MNSERKPSRAELGERAFVGLGGRTARVLAHGGHGDRSLALDAQYLYWSDDEEGEVVRLPKDGGLPVVLAQREYPRHLVLVGDVLYWSERSPMDHRGGDPWSRVVRMPKDGGDVTVIADGLEHVNAVVVRGDEVVILCDGTYDPRRREDARGEVLYLAPGATEPETLATRQRRPTAAVFLGDTLVWLNSGWKWPTYFADGALVQTKPAERAKPAVLRDKLPMAHALLADETHLYWVTTPTSVDPQLLAGVERRPLAGGEDEIICQVFSVDGALLAQDAENLYCLTVRDGSIERVTKDGRDIEELVRCDDRLLLPCSIAVDERRIYWAVKSAPAAGGAVWSVAKEPAGTRAPADDEAPAN